MRALWKTLVWCCLAATLSAQSTGALQNGLARTPPMGWLNWQRFTCQMDCVNYPDDCISASLFKQQAQRLVEDGYKNVGYEYVNIDDCWSEMERDRAGRLQPNKTSFPDGLGALADELHKKGLKIGLYGDCGVKTCAGYPAQLNAHDTHTTAADNHFEVDAATFADWHIDSFKMDGCFIDPLKAERVCPRFSNALAAQHQRQPILLMCEWPFYMIYTHNQPDWQVAADACNLWRYYDDIEDSWLSLLNTIDHSIKHQSTIVKYHGPGHWFDPDQLVVGNFGLSVGQARAQMAFWCLWSAPLYMSNDLRHIRPEFAAILKNKHLIGVNQDQLGVFGQMVASLDELQAFVKPVLPINEKSGCPSFVLLYFNRASLGNKRKVSFNLRRMLAAAPIRAAAKNELEVLDFEAKGNRPKIRASECLKRLRRQGNKMQPEQSSDNQPEVGPMIFEARDLYQSANLLGQIELEMDLPLEVEPQSVRIIKLEEV